MCPIPSTGLNASRLDTPSLYSSHSACMVKIDRVSSSTIATSFEHSLKFIITSRMSFGTHDMSRIQALCERSKLCNHARYTIFRITNENYTSQTCVYCFEKLHHPKQSITKQYKATKKTIKGIFICYNSKCPSIRDVCNTSMCDQLSALAIAI